MWAKVWIKEVTTCSPGVQDSEEAKKEKEEKVETPAEEEVKHEDNEWGKSEIVLSLIFMTKIAVQEITVKLTKP